MKGRCPRCQDIITVSGHRGSKLSDTRCTRCGVPLKSVNAGVKRARYTCPLTGKPVTLPGTGIVLDQPHQVVYLPACESPRAMVVDVDIHDSHRPEPAGVRLYPGGRTCLRCCRFVAFEGAFYQVTQVGYRPCVPGVLRGGETVLGTGAVVSDLAYRTIDSRPGEWLPFQLVPLTPDQASDPNTWIVNTPEPTRKRSATRA